MYYLGYNRASMNKIAIREQKNETEQNGKRQQLDKIVFENLITDHS